MIDYSIVEKFDILVSTISKSPFFAISAVVGLILLVLGIIGLVKRRKINRWIYVGGWFFVVVFFVIRYWSFIVGLGDNFINNVFMAIYFPNLAIYTTLFILCNGFFVYSIVNEKLSKVNKVINVVATILFDFLFLLIIDVVSTNGIDIYSSLTVYSNPILLVLLELSTALCLLWLAVTLMYKFILFFNSKRIPRSKELVVESPVTINIDGNVESITKDVSNNVLNESNSISLEKQSYNESLWNKSFINNELSGEENVSSGGLVAESSTSDLNKDGVVDSNVYDIFNLKLENDNVGIANFDNDSTFVWKVKTTSGSLSIDQVSIYKVMNLSLDKEVSNNVFNVESLSNNVLIGKNSFNNDNVVRHGVRNF